MDAAITAVLPLLASHGYRARCRWWWPWSRTWTFVDDRRNVVAVERAGAGYRVQRFRQRRGFTWAFSDGEAWTVAVGDLRLALLAVVPPSPWWSRQPTPHAVGWV